MQALAGDSTDNVPGVPGIGVKTAAELINEYGDLETLLARAGEIKQPKRRERLIEFAMQARLSLDLVTLKQDVPVTVPVEQLGVRDAEPAALLGFLREMEFGTLTKRIAEGLGAEAPPPVERSVGSTSHAEVRRAATDAAAKPGAKPATAPSGATPQAARGAGDERRQGQDRPLPVRDGDELPRLEAWIAEARAAGRFAFDTRPPASMPCRPSSSASRWPSHPAGPATCRSAIAPAAASTSARAYIEQVPLREALAVLKPLLEDPSVLKIGQNLKYDSLVLAPLRHRARASRRHPAAVLCARCRA